MMAYLLANTAPDTGVKRTLGAVNVPPYGVPPNRGGGEIRAPYPTGLRRLSLAGIGALKANIPETENIAPSLTPLTFDGASGQIGYVGAVTPLNPIVSSAGPLGGANPEDPQADWPSGGIVSDWDDAQYWKDQANPEIQQDIMNLPIYPLEYDPITGGIRHSDQPVPFVPTTGPIARKSKNYVFTDPGGYQQPVDPLIIPFSIDPAQAERPGIVQSLSDLTVVDAPYSLFNDPSVSGSGRVSVNLPGGITVEAKSGQNILDDILAWFKSDSLIGGIPNFVPAGAVAWFAFARGGKRR